MIGSNELPSVTVASPKSRSFALPSSVIIALAGFTSRCSTPHAMRGREPAREIDRDRQDLAPRDGPIDLIERPPANVFGDQIRMSRDLGDPIDRDDVRVLEACDRACLVEEPRAGGGILGGLHELHRDGTIEQRIVREIDEAHRAATERSHEAIFLERLRRAPLDGHRPISLRERSPFRRS